ncbi:MAG TPA: hypothetical protein VEG84_11345 [Thermoanaerobaculia bacterium]|nr:hypothetical protein [Thermoanaerobaculia bacterium]
MTGWLKRLFGGSESSTSEASEPATAPEPLSAAAEPAEPPAEPGPVEAASDAGDEPA